MLSQVFEIVAPLLIIASVGYVYGVRVKPEMQFTNRLVMDVFMPALILQVMLTEGFNVADYSGLIFAGVLLMLVSGIIIFTITCIRAFPTRLCRWKKVTFLHYLILYLLKKSTFK